jgi:hypothetical protein
MPHKVFRIRTSELVFMARSSLRGGTTGTGHTIRAIITLIIGDQRLKL